MIAEHILSNWCCLACGMVTPGGQPDPYACCTRPFVLRVRAVKAIPEVVVA